MTRLAPLLLGSSGATTPTILGRSTSPVVPLLVSFVYPKQQGNLSGGSTQALPAYSNEKRESMWMYADFGLATSYGHYLDRGLNRLEARRYQSLGETLHTFANVVPGFTLLIDPLCLASPIVVECTSSLYYVHF